MKRYLWATAVLTVVAVGAFGQDSLGEVARQNREKKANQPKAKTVIDDDTRPSIKNTSPFPEIQEQGFDNSDDVTKAMEDYRLSHSPEEMEGAVKQWYESHDKALQTAIDEGKMLKERHLNRINGRSLNVTDRTNDYQQYYRQRDTERDLDDYDRKKCESDGLLTTRIQQAFQKVRWYLMSKNLKYEWFKIRFGNGNGSW